MALNFPNNPNEGDIHSDQNVLWVYRNGRWVRADVPDTIREFHDPTGAASWQIIGNKLECWGRATTGAQGTGFLDVTFPKTFARVPAISLGIDDAAGSIVNALGITTVTTFRAFTKDINANTPANRTFSWHAVGEWDGIS